LRLVEADRSIAELERRPRRRHCVPLRGKVVVETALDAFDRKQLGCRPPIAIDCKQFDRGEPVQPAGEPGNLSVMAERRINESCRAKKGAHQAAL
jgi:hypothetical protein